MFCARCGTEVLPEHKFCKSCGAVQGAQAAMQDTAGLYAQRAEPMLQQVATGAIPVGQAGVAPGVFQGAAQGVYYVTPQMIGQAQTVHQTNLLHSLQGRLQSLASTESLEGFSLTEMFSEVFKRRGGEAVEEYLLVGTSKTTPPIELVETGWPKPWLFFRMLAALVIAYFALTFLFFQTGNTNFIPGMMFLGAFAVPLATLTLFFEWNTPRNVSIHTVGKLFLMGAIVSLAVALLGYSMPIFDLSDMEAGIVEEVAKLLTVVVVMRSVRYKYILNGILFGAVVGAGFAAFETAGYALNDGFLQGLLPTVVKYGSLKEQVVALAIHRGVIGMLQVLRLRGILTPLGHVAWTALAAGAFWRVKQDKKTSFTMLFDKRFLKAFLIPVVLHAIWDAPWQLPFSGNQILTGIVAWYVVFGLVQQGLRQVKAEQKEQLQTTLATVEAQMQPASAAN